MLTETISGKCPCCGYDKLFQRYGSMGYYQLDACLKCGFGYGSNYYDNEVFGIKAWIDYGRYMLEMIEGHGLSQEDIQQLPNLKVREMLFEWVEKEERCDDISTTIFEYSDEEVEKYKNSNPIIMGEE